MHGRFVEFARTLLGKDEQRSARFERMVEVAGIAHRYSCLDPDSGFYEFGRFPTIAERMRVFDRLAPELAAAAIERLDLGAERDRVTHLLITCCTGFSSPASTCS